MNEQEGPVDFGRIMKEQLPGFQATAQALDESIGELTALFPNQWIAMQQGHDLIINPTFDGTMEMVSELGLDSKFTVIKHLRENPINEILMLDATTPGIAA